MFFTRKTREAVRGGVGDEEFNGRGYRLNLKTAITPLRSASIEVIFVAQAS